MNLTKPYGPRDEVSKTEGDDYFVGVEERFAPNQVPTGYVSSAKNMRFRKGKAESRRGIQVCPWMKDDGLTPWGEVYGAAVFSDPNQPAEWIVVAADGGVWRTRPNMTAKPVNLPANTSLSADSFAMFVQCFNVLILLRGPDYAPLVCTDLDIGFTAIPGPSGGLQAIPNSSFGLNFLNRLLLVKGKDELAVSDALDYTSYLAATNTTRINQGSVDRLVALSGIDKQRVVCLKDQSVLAVAGIGTDLTNADLQDVTNKYGLEAAHGYVRSGNNLYWVTEGGHIASMELTSQNELQDTEQFLSMPLLQTFGRINPLYIEGMLLEIWDGKLYVAMPLDDASNLVPRAWIYNGFGTLTYEGLTPGAKYYWQRGPNEYSIHSGSTFLVGTDGLFIPETTTAVVIGPHDEACTGRLTLGPPGANNAVAVYDFHNQAWCGVDEAAGVVNVKQWLKLRYRGKKRLFALGTDGVLRLWEEGYEDEVLSGGVITCQGVPAEVLTRGYRCQDADRKRFLSLGMVMRTWAPQHTVSAVRPDYGNETEATTDETRDPTVSEIHDQPAYDATNADDDHEAAGRQDYSVPVTANGVAVGSGINVDAHQTSTLRLPVSEFGVWMQARIANATGRLELVVTGMESERAERLSGNVI